MPRPAYSRRDFLRQTAATASAAASAGVGVAAQSFGGSPHGRLRVGIIGAGVRGQQHLEALARLRASGWNLDIAGICDVYLRHREQAQRGGADIRAVGKPKKMSVGLPYSSSRLVDAPF